MTTASSGRGGHDCHFDSPSQPRDNGNDSLHSHLNNEVFCPGQGNTPRTDTAPTDRDNAVLPSISLDNGGDTINITFNPTITNENTNNLTSGRDNSSDSTGGAGGDTVSDNQQFQRDLIQSLTNFETMLTQQLMTFEQQLLGRSGGYGPQNPFMPQPNYGNPYSNGFGDSWFGRPQQPQIVFVDLPDDMFRGGVGGGGGTGGGGSNGDGGFRLPGLPQLPGLPDLPGLPELPNLPGLPGFNNGGDSGNGDNGFQLPGLPELPSLPGLPGFGGSDNGNNNSDNNFPLPGLPNLPGLPGFNNGGGNNGGNRVGLPGLPVRLPNPVQDIADHDPVLGAIGDLFGW